MNRHDDPHDVDVVREIEQREPVAASESFQERVMKAIHEERIAENRKAGAARRVWLRWVPAAVAALLLLMAVPVIDGLREGGSKGAAVLAQSVAALGKVQSVRIQGRIRSVAGDNFELIGAGYDFVPVEIWREYGNPPRWRLEKPGRVVTMDGRESVMYLEKSNTAMRGGVNSGFVEWLRPLLDPQAILRMEMRAANAGEARMIEQHEAAAKLIAVERKAKGDFRNAWARNQSIQESNHTCVYRFDESSGLLEGLTVKIQTEKGEVTVAEFDRFTYNEPMPDGLFRQVIPENAVWAGKGVKETARRFLGPKEAARHFFESLGRKDWEAVLEVYPMTAVPEDLRRSGYGGAELISLGEPFQSGLYRGWFVPYELRMGNGHVKKHNLAVRNDNPQGRWVVDGGY